MIAPAVAAIVASFIAGHPVKIVCDADVNPGPVPPAPGFIIEAWTPFGGDTIHMHPEVCLDLSSPPGTRAFARGLAVLLHESAHAAGIKPEPCAEAHAHAYAYGVLHRFYRVPRTDARAQMTVAVIATETELRPPSYQLDGSECVAEVMRRAYAPGPDLAS